MWISNLHPIPLPITQNLTASPKNHQGKDCVQLNHIVADKELLGITESLKHFRYTILRNQIRVYTNHNNLTYSGTWLNSDRRIRQRLLIEEYDAKIIFVAGDKNVIVDGMSRLDFQTSPDTQEQCYIIVKDKHTTPPFDLQLIA